MFQVKKKISFLIQTLKQQNKPKANRKKEIKTIRAEINEIVVGKHTKYTK